MYSRSKVIKLIHEFTNSEEVAYIMDGYYCGCEDATAEQFIERIKL